MRQKEFPAFSHCPYCVFCTLWTGRGRICQESGKADKEAEKRRVWNVRVLCVMLASSAEFVAKLGHLTPKGFRKGKGRDTHGKAGHGQGADGWKCKGGKANE